MTTTPELGPELGPELVAALDVFAGRIALSLPERIVLADGKETSFDALVRPSPTRSHDGTASRRTSARRKPFSNRKIA